MSRRILSILSALAFVALLVPAQNAQANPDHIIRYLVYGSLNCGGCGLQQGEWDIECDDSFSGWGSQPGTENTYTVTEQGAPCTCGPDFCN
jgi:hypothetical protein